MLHWDRLPAPSGSYGRWILFSKESNLVSELSAPHTFVFGGDIRKGSDNIELTFLGAILEPAASGRGTR